MASHTAPAQPGHGGNLVVEPAGTPKRPRFIWTPQLHNLFIAVVAHLGPRNAVPKAIMQLMNVNGLTRKNIASHLQKYRLRLNRRQRSTVGGGSEVVVTHNQFNNGCPCCRRSADVALQHPQGMVLPTYPPHIIRVSNPWQVEQFGSSSSSWNGSLLHMGIPVYNTSAGEAYGQEVDQSGYRNGRELKLLNLFPMKDV